jgi:hypothetical protein
MSPDRDIRRHPRKFSKASTFFSHDHHTGRTPSSRTLWVLTPAPGRCGRTRPGAFGSGAPVRVGLPQVLKSPVSDLSMLLAIQPGDREHILRFRIIAGVCRRNSFLAVGGSDLMRNRVSIESPGRFTPTLLDGCPDFLFLHWCQIVELEAFGNPRSRNASSCGPAFAYRVATR